MSEENDDNSIGIEKDGDTENEDVVVQDKSCLLYTSTLPTICSV